MPDEDPENRGHVWLLTEWFMDRILENGDMLNNRLRLVIRIVVASYFMAVGLGMVPGTGLQGLTDLILPQPASNLLAGLVVIALAAMILLGRSVTAAALGLSLLLFLSSYLAMVQIGVAEQLGQFWRDIALIGALVLAHGIPNTKPAAPVQIFSKPGPTTHGIVGEMVPTELRLAPRHSLAVWRSTRPDPDLPPLNDADDIKNIFAVSA